MVTLAFVPLFIGTTELLLIGGLALLLFGGKKLPEMMKGLGQGVKSFKEGMNSPAPENNNEGEKEVNSEATPEQQGEKIDSEKKPDVRE